MQEWQYGYCAAVVDASSGKAPSMRFMECSTCGSKTKYRNGKCAACELLNDAAGIYVSADRLKEHVTTLSRRFPPTVNIDVTIAHRIMYSAAANLVHVAELMGGDWHKHSQGGKS